jgi:membrane-bound lytic murein transglycosylase D
MRHSGSKTKIDVRKRGRSGESGIFPFFLFFLFLASFVLIERPADALSVDDDAPPTPPAPLQAEPFPVNLPKAQLERGAARPIERQPPETPQGEDMVTLSPTPLEEIDEEVNVPEDFFDIEALMRPPVTPLPPEITYDVPIEFNRYVDDYIILFQTRLREKFELWLTRSGRYIDMMKSVFRENELPEDLVFLALVESGFNPYAYSRSRAVGPWQFMKGTAKKYGLKVNRWVDERRDPIKSTAAAARYLKDLFGMFNSWPLSLASYNAGEGRIMRAMNRSKVKVESFWDLRTSRHLRTETKHYVPKFMAATIMAKNPAKYGFDLEYWSPMVYDEVQVDRQISLQTVARITGADYQVIKELNPELRLGVTPPAPLPYTVRLPVGTREEFLKSFSSIPETELRKELKVSPEVQVRRHRVRRGETLTRLAKRYGTTVAKIQKINGLADRNAVRAGQTLLVPTRDSDD